MEYHVGDRKSTAGELYRGQGDQWCCSSICEYRPLLKHIYFLNFTMFPCVTKIVGVAALLASVAHAQNFRVVASFNTGLTTNYRAWYGDGHMYIGPWVPASLENTLNFTSMSRDV